MLLALDVGNTNIVVGCMEGKTPLRAFRLATRRDSTGGDYAAAISQLLELAGISRQDVEQVIISSVVPQVTRALQGTALLLTGKEPLVLGQNVRCDLPILIHRIGIFLQHFELLIPIKFFFRRQYKVGRSIPLISANVSPYPRVAFFNLPNVQELTHIQQQGAKQGHQQYHTHVLFHGVLL